MGNYALLINQPSEYLLHLTTSIIQNDMHQGNICLCSTCPLVHPR